VGESESYSIMAYCYDTQIWGNGGMITGRRLQCLEKELPLWYSNVPGSPSLGDELMTDYLSYGTDHAINWVPTD
jgi:hypothetical protein